MTKVMKTIDELQTQWKIISTKPTLKDLLNPVKKTEIGDLLYKFLGRN